MNIGCIRLFKKTSIFRALQDPTPVPDMEPNAKHLILPHLWPDTTAQRGSLAVVGSVVRCSLNSGMHEQFI